jgi:hypothetical protein
MPTNGGCRVYNPFRAGVQIRFVCGKKIIMNTAS